MDVEKERQKVSGLTTTSLRQLHEQLAQVENGMRSESGIYAQAILIEEELKRRGETFAPIFPRT